MKKAVLLLVMAVFLVGLVSADSYFTGYKWYLANSSGGLVSPYPKINTTTLEASAKFENVWINASYILNAPWTEAAGSSDGNNYTSSISFTGKTLTLARSGMSSLSAALPDNSIKLALTNLTGSDSNQCSGTDKVTNVSLVNGDLTVLCGTDQTGGVGGGITEVRGRVGINVTDGTGTPILDINQTYLDTRYIRTDTNDTGLYYTKSEVQVQNTSYYNTFWKLSDAQVQNTSLWNSVNAKMSLVDFQIQNTSLWTSINNKANQADMVTNNASVYNAIGLKWSLSDAQVQNTSLWSAINAKVAITDFQVQNTSYFSTFWKLSDAQVQNTTLWASINAKLATADFQVQNTSYYNTFWKLSDAQVQNTSIWNSINLKMALADYQVQNTSLWSSINSKQPYTNKSAQCTNTADRLYNVTEINGVWTAVCGTDATGAGSSDGNNYTTALSVTGRTISMSRNGLTDLTANLADNSILLDAGTNLSNKAGLANTHTLDAQYNLTNKGGLANSHTLDAGYNLTNKAGLNNAITLDAINITSGTFPNARIGLKSINNESLNTTNTGTSGQVLSLGSNSQFTWVTPGSDTTISYTYIPANYASSTLATSTYVMQWNLTANKNYYLVCMAMHQTAATTTGININMTCSSTPTAFNMTLSGGSLAGKNGCAANTAGLVTTGVQVQNVPQDLRIQAYVEVGASNIHVNMTMGSEVAASNAILYKGGLCTLKQLN